MPWGLGKGLQQLGGHRAEPTKHSFEPLCIALLSWKLSMWSSPALQLWLQGQNVTCPAAAAVGDAWAPMAPGHDLTSGLGREMGVSGITQCCVLGLCPLPTGLIFPAWPL